MLFVTTKQEIKSFIANPKFYLQDPWNYIDMCIFILVIIFLYTLNKIVLAGRYEEMGGFYGI